MAATLVATLAFCLVAAAVVVVLVLGIFKLSIVVAAAALRVETTAVFECGKKCSSWYMYTCPSCGSVTCRNDRVRM